MLALTFLSAAVILPNTSIADSNDDILYRVQKIGRLNIVDSAAPAAAPATEAATAADSAEQTASADSAEGASGGVNAADLYQASCFACHGTGAAGAPILGDNATWGPRIEQGEASLLDHAINGFNAMPPRGGSSLNDDEIKSIVAYMVESSQ